MESTISNLKYGQVASNKDIVKRDIHFFIDSRLHHFKGSWFCELQTDELFCSDVIFAISDEFNIINGARCLIHPDDVQLINNYILAPLQKAEGHFTIRLITTYGKIVQLIVYNITKEDTKEGIVENIAEQSYRQYIIEKELIAIKERDELQLKTYSYSEKILSFGISYYNSSTHETYYTDGVFHIHGLPPQSLNPHFHTFSSFIHPDDKIAITHALEKSYELQVPVHVEYRILLKNSELRYISYSGRCFHNNKGELVICGIIEDTTERKLIDTEIENVRNDMELRDKMMRHSESMVKMANWYVNLLTRKIMYSDQIYKLYGLKAVGNPINVNALMHFVHPDDIALVTEANRKILYEHIAPDIEYRITTPEGRLKWLRQKGKTVINKFNELIMLGTIVDITEYKSNNLKINKLKEELDINKNSFKLMEEVCSSASWVWNLDTGNIKWSEGVYDLIGSKNKGMDITHRMFLNYVYPSDREKFTEQVNSILSDKKESEFQFRILRKGDTRYIHAHFQLDETNDKRIFLAILRDVTSFSELQKQLSDNEKMMETLNDTSTNQVIITDINNYIVKWNSICENEYGIKKEMAIGTNIFDIFPRLKTNEIIQNLQKVLNGEEIVLKEITSHISGNIQDVFMKPVRDENNNIKGALTIIRNVTKEYELKQQLTSRLHFIERLMESSVDRIIVLDKNMNYLLWNHKAEQYYGILKEQVIGKNILELFPGFIDDPSYSEFRNVLRGQTVHIPAIKNLENKKGYFETYLIPVKDNNGLVNAVLWIVHDLVGEYQLAQQQRKAIHILESINEAYLEIDYNGVIRYMNSKAEKFFDLRKAEMIGIDIFAALNTMLDKAFIGILKTTLNEKEDVRGEYFDKRSASQIYLSCTCTPDGVIVLFYEKF
ncbi:MAG: PAS domain S-box protein [Flavisolibacter sp.]